MRLAAFIEKNREAILAEWEAFARTCSPASESMNIAALRDHAGEMLAVIAKDLKTPQTESEEKEKSEGNAPPEDPTKKTAAQKHGADRAENGFTTDQMVAEYRALRASVVRLWIKDLGKLGETEIDDLTRFNEAIDQALAESIARYTKGLENSKEMFLAILGHDLRSPLNAVLMSAKFMLETGDLKEPHTTLAERIVSSAHRMNDLVVALLDFTRSRLGGGIPVNRVDMDLGKTVENVSAEAAAAHPKRNIEVKTSGNLHGEWDCDRITQVLSNLIGNALDYGADGTGVLVTVDGESDNVTLAIHNRGAAIARKQLSGIFSPMKRSKNAGPTASGSLGLGLYIAERIVNAHEGRIDVESSDAEGTTFTVHLPRKPRTQPVAG